MKEWKEAGMAELDVKKTAFGPYSPEIPDSEKTAVTDDEGNILGYERGWGESASLSH